MKGDTNRISVRTHGSEYSSYQDADLFFVCQLHLLIRSAKTCTKASKYRPKQSVSVPVIAEQTIAYASSLFALIVELIGS
jgi:hypothetical protein